MRKSWIIKNDMPVPRLSEVLLFKFAPILRNTVDAFQFQTNITVLLKQPDHVMSVN